MSEQKDKRLFVSTIILVVVHLSGVIGIHSQYKDLFLLCTPLNLLISAALLFLNQKEFSLTFYIFCLVAFLTGLTVEWIGIHTGLLFGSYSYGDVLGIKISGVPLIIGINWLLLVFSVGVICNKIKTNIFIKSLLGALLLVILDFFIEPVAVKYYFWSWYDTAPPIRNYTDWFIISFLLLLLFNKLEFNKTNPLAKALFLVQLVFFISLTFF